MSSNESRPQLPAALRFFALFSVGLTILAWVSILVCRLLNLRDLPYGGYLLPRIYDYADMGILVPRFKYFHSSMFFSPNVGYPYLYPPAVAPFYKAFYLFHHPVIVFLLFLVVVLSSLAGLMVRALSRHGVPLLTAVVFSVVCVVFSYAFYFEVNRANMEIFIWLFSALGVYFFTRGHSWKASGFIGLAAAMKLFPIFYLGLLLSRRQYRQAFFGIFVAGVVSLISLWAICPDIRLSLHGILSGLHGFDLMYVQQYRPLEIGIDHSLFGFIKRVLGPLPSERYKSILTVYMALAAIAGITLYFFRIRFLPVVNQVLCLAIACILLPPTSYDYTLLHLYTAWVLMVILCVDAYHRGAASVKGVWPAFVCFAILLSQVGEIILHGERLGGQIKALVLIALFYIALRYPFHSVYDQVESRLGHRAENLYIPPAAIG